MEQLLTGNIWKQVSGIAKQAKRRMVAVAYVTSPKSLNLKKGDVLICDASPQAIRNGETSAHALESLHDKGVQVYSWPDLHAKAAVLGKSALIGSCNLSLSSAAQLTELAVLTRRPQVVAQTTAFIHGLREHATPVDRPYLDRILKVTVQRQRRRLPARRVPEIRLGNRVWLVAVRQLDDTRYPKEQSDVSRGEKKAEQLVADKDATVSWIRWTGKSTFREKARPGDIVIQIWTSLSGKRTTVYSPCPIVLRQDVAHWSRFYISEPEDHKGISWARFKAQVKDLHLPRVSKGTVREMKPREVLQVERIWK